MRDAINNNPRVQMAVLGIGGLLFALLMFKTFSSGGSEPPPPAAAVATTAVPGLVVTPPAGVPPLVDPTAPTDTAGDPVSLKTGPGLPEAFASAYNEDQPVVLLVVSRDGHTDRALERFVAKAVDDPAELIVISDRRIADYAAVVDGLSINRTPAVVFVRPKSLSGGTPVAEVRYGFLTPRSIRQGIEDATYEGPDRNYSP